MLTFNLSELENLSGAEVIDYLISVYESSEDYLRCLALDLEYYEFMTNSDIYSLYGIDSIYYTKFKDKIILSGNTDIFINFPNFIRYESVFDFKIHSLGSKLLSDIDSKYRLLCDSPRIFEVGTVNEDLLLYYNLDLSYLKSLSRFNYFYSDVLVDFYLSNIDLIKTQYYLTENGMLDLFELLDILLVNPQIKSILKTKDFILEIDTDGYGIDFYTIDISYYLKLKDLFQSLSLSVTSELLMYTSRRLEESDLIKHFFNYIKSEGISLLIRDFGDYKLLNFMFSIGDFIGMYDS